MEISNNISLKTHTTLSIGGIAQNFYEPESINDLLMLFKDAPTSKYYILGGGSNLLIDDRKVFENVISMNKINGIIVTEDGCVEAEAGARNQQLIQTLIAHGMGGVEYLSSIPGTIGGAVVMNAGTGKSIGRYIGDYVISVTVINNGTVVSLNKKDCAFEFRNSIFQKSNMIVLKVVFKFPLMDKAKFIENIAKHIGMIKKSQDLQKPNIGSVFNVFNPKIIAIVQRLQLGYKKGIRFSKKTPDWIVNNGKGTFCQAVSLIHFVTILHHIFFKKVRTEVIVWK